MDATDQKRLLREMLFARRFEERCAEAYHERQIGGFLHLYPGEEACAIGVLEKAQTGSDYVVTGYRDHIHALKSGMDPKALMAELFGKEAGCSKGRGGSMHLFDPDVHFMGGYALVGGPFPLAAGFAKAIQLRGGQEISICFLGDGANNQGTFHETMNMASLWNLPVLFICENNLYGIGTAIERSTVEINQYKRVAPYGIEAAQCDGQDIDIVMAHAEKAVNYVREQRKPYFLELMTYRLRGHSMSDSGAYRSKEEVEEWAQRDPIGIYKRRLVEAGVVTEDEFHAMDKAVQDEIENEVVRYAIECPEPRVEDVARYVYTEGGNNHG
ncbi:pyruvate dehydrogenase (acetyl-transferring) E1 component subunit alpha [Acidithiobacillus sp.]|uniref:pyruvate dehydrogenase (acetyl-transferring) E1 component subunit alpha n=1 Tax=Acidithiobacillus sp. TaxID=1872118 RepID=UPI002622759F|nr:pyruvate dehydrogenase (acetyl-transferring) E1 component subunit alpha [Acidithiobacillus sp.]MDD5278323.1 pyruvate dehydrogenase (acetyl-transferring) E1 component subunit alpha [Acidithiobacillus sp.]